VAAANAVPESTARRASRLPKRLRSPPDRTLDMLDDFENPDEAAMARIPDSYQRSAW